MFQHPPSTLLANPPGAYGASRASHLCVSLVAHSASDFAGSAMCLCLIRHSPLSRTYPYEVGSSNTLSLLRRYTTLFPMQDDLVLGVSRNHTKTLIIEVRSVCRTLHPHCAEPSVVYAYIRDTNFVPYGRLAGSNGLSGAWNLRNLFVQRLEERAECRDKTQVRVKRWV